MSGLPVSTIPVWGGCPAPGNETASERRQNKKEEKKKNMGRETYYYT